MNLLLDQLANFEITAQYRAFVNGLPHERCIWVENGQPHQLDQLLTHLTQEHAACPSRPFTTYCNRAERSLFAPFKRLLAETQPLWSQWNWIKDYAHELNTLVPGTFGPEYNVNRVGTGWSEVRLNGDIAWGFRLLHFLAVFVQELAKKQPLMLVLHDVQYADRLSLQLVYHLVHNLQADKLLIVLLRRPYDWDGASTAMDNGAAMEKWFARFLAKVKPLFLSGATIRTVGSGEGSEQEEEFSATSAAAVEPAGQTPLHAPDRVQESLVTLRVGDFDVRKVLGNLHEALVWYNFDNTLLLAGEILHRLDDIEPALVPQVEFEVWRHIGIAHAFMEHFPESLHAFNRMYNCASNLAEQAKALHFLALLYGKRMKRWDISKQIVYKGIEMTADSNEFDVVYERCWLYNYLAYVDYSVDRDFKMAMEHVLTAYRDMRPFQGYNRSGNVMDEIADPKLPIRLLANAEANIAYLHYYSGNYRLALTTWQGAVPKFTAQAPIYFRKEYYHFEGNIYRKLGQYALADDRYQTAYQICLDHADSYHAELVTQSLGHTHFLAGHFAEAAKWYKRSLELKGRVGDLRRAKNLSSIILSHLLAGDQATAQEWFERRQQELDPRFHTLYLTDQLLTAKHDEFLEQGPPILIQAYPQMRI